MLIVRWAAELADHVGQRIGSSEWVEIDQRMIDLFAEATGDRQWIHVDVERARREAPGGTTIAHGYLTLSLIAGLTPELYRVEERSRSLNYGVDRIRFPAPVPAGTRVRVHMTVVAVEPLDAGVRLRLESQVEIEGGSRPACVAETITMIYD